MKAQLLLGYLLVSRIYGFSWGASDQGVEPVPEKPSELLQKSRLPNIYAVALSELQELEQEPLCHRVAARLLVNNCQLVDGKDETTILTDSGRQIRDFVDSYAASLAICDLERGSFIIPNECAKFREPSLTQIAIRNTPQLHVSSKEISLCLSALAASDAAWSTWVSYRHKALRFCEAARADNEKAQHILLYQRLTKVIAKLTDGVEAELQRLMDDLDNRARQSAEKLDELAPKISLLNEGLQRIEHYFSGNLDMAMKKTSEAMHASHEHAENLQQVLNILLTNVIQGQSQLAFAHEQSLQHATEKVQENMEAFVAVVSTAIASSTSLQQQLQLSFLHTAHLAQRQDALEQGMDRLLATTEALSTKFEDQSSLLLQANNITNDILDALEETAKLASSMNESFLSRATAHSWWPLVVFPTASLIMGSYGLAPSVLRNIGLLALGEMIGLAFSSYSRLSELLSFAQAQQAVANVSITGSL